MLGRNLTLLYEDHIMSHEDDDLPREPNYHTELYCNLEGMVKAWTRFGIYPSWARKASKASSAGPSNGAREVQAMDEVLGRQRPTL